LLECFIRVRSSYNTLRHALVVRHGGEARGELGDDHVGHAGVDGARAQKVADWDAHSGEPALAAGGLDPSEEFGACSDAGAVAQACEEEHRDAVGLRVPMCGDCICVERGKLGCVGVPELVCVESKP
jgi:hypothetical protein